MASGAAETTLNVLQDILQELSETAQRSGISSSADIIIANIKNTMSDRAAAQKSFNSLLSNYRSDILPDVVNNWDELSKDEQTAISQMHHFYCAMHLVVNMAEHSSESLKLIERNFNLPTSEHVIHKQGESGTIRLIRTACKAFERRGDEKSGCPVQFATYLNRKGVSCKLIHFRGNRFNIIFANGARVYYLHQHIIDFLNSWGTPNRLLQAVLEDVSNDVNVAGSKALGLINKNITGPLWRILESGIQVTDLPQYYTKLKEFLDQCTETNINTFMTGEKIPFGTEFVKKDDVWQALTTPSSHDGKVEIMLLSIFKSFQLLLDRLLVDHSPIMTSLKENKEKLHTETKSVPTTNVISERDFAIFDRLIREKPNASTLALEAHILFTNNKTSEWFTRKSEKERDKMMADARKNAPLYRKRYQQRKLQIEEERTRQQAEKQRAKEEAQRKLLATKEKLTMDILDFGLWQTETQVDSNLESLRSESQKREALKAQLRFRKTVLLQEASETLFRFSAKGKGQFTSQVLRTNLVELIKSAGEIESSPSSWAGKMINHRFKESNGKYKCYKGKIISQVPGFPEWFNVVYDNEPDIVYSYNLTEDIENGDLRAL